MPNIDQAAFFAAVRAELQETFETKIFVVPRSFTAAFLAGLVVGCALAGLDVRGDEGASHVASVAAIIGVHVDTANLLPAMILLGLLSGARVAAMTMMLVHTLLSKAGWTDHFAYVIGGAGASAGLAALFFVCGRPPAHGWPVELLAGAGAGLLYRVFAGTRPAV